MRGIYRFFNVAIPVSRCNLNCSYCYIGQRIKCIEKPDESLNYSIDHMRRSLTVERLGGACMFNLCADGETLLFRELSEVVNMLLELGHYVSIVTNATLTYHLEKLIELPKPLLKRLFIKASVHYLELRSKELLNRFFYNINIIKKNDIAYSVEICASDDYIPYIEEIKEICRIKIGALPHVVELRDESKMGLPRLTKLEIEEYQKIWYSFKSPLFDYETKNYEKYQDRFCYAGDYGLALSLQSGETTSCSGSGIKKTFNIFENPEEPLNFVAIGRNCPSAHCFLNYVWCSLVGNYPGIDVPTYAQERDRVTLDGTYWLTPLYQEVYSHRCSEYHKPYSENKAFYIDLLMRKYYKGVAPNQEELKNLAGIVESYLLVHGIRTVAIYGMGIMGKWLIDILKSTNIQIACGIDKRWEEIETYIPAQSPNSPLPPIDGIIVSVFAEFTNIAPMLRRKTQARILSLVELGDLPDSV